MVKNVFIGKYIWSLFELDRIGLAQIKNLPRPSQNI